MISEKDPFIIQLLKTFVVCSCMSSRQCQWLGTSTASTFGVQRMLRYDTITFTTKNTIEKMNIPCRLAERKFLCSTSSKVGCLMIYTGVHLGVDC